MADPIEKKIPADTDPANQIAESAEVTPTRDSDDSEDEEDDRSGKERSQEVEPGFGPNLSEAAPEDADFVDDPEEIIDHEDDLTPLDVDTGADLDQDRLQGADDDHEYDVVETMQKTTGI